jgi:hypothetical protein
MSLLGFDAPGRWAIGQLPVNGNVALLAAASSFAAAGQANTFKIVDPQNGGSFAFAGVAGRLNIGGASTVGSFSLTGTSIAFKLSEVLVVGGYVVTGVASHDLIKEGISSAGTFALTAIGAAVSISLGPSAVSFATVGLPAILGRDFVNWVQLLAASDSWRGEDAPASAWSTTGLPASSWSSEHVPTPDWSPFPPPSNLWTVDPAQQISPPVTE